METGISEEEYNELFWGPVGEYDYDSVISAQEENWERSNREFERTEYYNPRIKLGVQDSVLRENGNIYEPQVNEIIDDIIIIMEVFAHVVVERYIKVVIS